MFLIGSAIQAVRAIGVAVATGKQETVDLDDDDEDSKS